MEQRIIGNHAHGVIDAGEGVELRPLCPDHADALHSAIERNRERLGRWLPWAGPAYSLSNLRRFLEEQQAENLARTALTTGVWSRGVVCGSMGLHHIDAANRCTSIGYWIDEAHEGRGIVTRACRAIVTEGFRNYGLHRIEIRCAVGNGRSSAVPRRLGFIPEGVLREAQWLNNRWVDLDVYAMLEQDWVAE